MLIPTKINRSIPQSGFGLLIIIFFLPFFTSCTEPNYPKPKGFPRMILPKSTYKKFENPAVPFTFEYPSYGKINEKRIDLNFLDIDFPQYNCKWHITTRRLDSKKTTYHYCLEDYRDLIFKHTQKGTIDEKNINRPNGKGVFFELYGEVPTSADFFFSDSVNYALNLSFYFNTALKNDSLQPVIKHMKQELHHMIETIRFNKL